MYEEINAIAARIAEWARTCPVSVEKTAGYCMSGSWDRFYQRFFFPNGMPHGLRYQLLVSRLRDFGYRACMHIDLFPNSTGLHMHMQLKPLT